MGKTYPQHLPSLLQIKKNLFQILTTEKTGPSIHTLILLFKSLVQSRIDYGLIAYGNASKSNLTRIDVISRTIKRIILGARGSTPK
jgi:predicted component of type VI protein secretion system